MQQNSADKEQPILTAESPFRFSCNDNLPCFTQCCRDVNIYLTPYDVLRLRRALKLSSAEVLEQYTRYFLAGAGSIPVVQLLMDPGTLYCQLVTDLGCAVYEDRPWSCRMYPLDVAEQEGQYVTVVEKKRCLGLGEPSSSTAGEWLQGQGLDGYVEMDRAFQSVVPEPGAEILASHGQLLFLAYDLDRFKEMLKDSGFRKSCDVDDDLLRRVQEDDGALLMLAFRYIRNQLDELYQQS